MRKLMERRPDFNVDELKALYVQYKTIVNSGDKDELKKLCRMTTHGESQRIEKDTAAKLTDRVQSKSWKALCARKTPSQYEVEVAGFEQCNCYLGSMTNEDWMQITVKVQGKQKYKKDEVMEEFTEFPVFEVKLGDGIKTTNNSPFIVVALMDKDGARLGRDGQDAVQLRKQLAQAKKSWWKGG
jgi:hypothetical protein